jgi:hypothetical protein
MIKDDVPGTSGFEPPQYRTSLIAAVNDGAKAVQGGALLFLLIGIYLLATAFSTSAEDLLLGKTVTIVQMGAALPVSFFFAIAPARVRVPAHLRAGALRHAGSQRAALLPRAAQYGVAEARSER